MSRFIVVVQGIIPARGWIEGEGLGWIQGWRRGNESVTPTREPDLPRNTPRTIASQKVYPIPPSVFTISIFVQFFSLILGADLRTHLTLDVGEDHSLNPLDQCERGTSGQQVPTF
jgi:hypothetical protein